MVLNLVPPPAVSAAALDAAVNVELSALSASIAAEAAARITALAASISGLRPFNVLNHGVVCDGVTDDTAAYQAVINAAAAAGGGVVFHPAGLTPALITQTLFISRSGVVLRGEGHETEHDFTPSWASIANTAPCSGLLWGGAAGGTMISVAPLANADNGAGLGGCGVVGMNLFAGSYPFTSVAAYGVVTAACRGGEFDLFGLEFSGAALFFSALSRNTTWQNSSQFNRVRYLGARNVSTSGSALLMDGVTGCGNAYNNIIDLVDALYCNGNAIDLRSADNNVFLMARLQRAAGGTGAGVYFRSSVLADMPARDNIFHLLSPGTGGAYSDGSLTYPAYGNKILFYDPDENSAPPVPIIGIGSTLYWASSDKSGACNFQAEITAGQSVPNAAQTKIGFNAVVFDEATWYDTTNYRWKPRYPGMWFFVATVQVTLTAAASNVQIILIQNGGSGSALRTITSLPVGLSSVSVSGMMGFDGVASYIEVYLYQNSGAAASIAASTSDNHFFQGSRIG